MNQDPAKESKAFAQHWTAQILNTPPLIAPARQFTYPRQIAGEEDALARGALQLLVHPANAPSFLSTCALGFTDSSMPTGVFSCPNPRELCAVAGGYAYLIDTAQPDRSTHLTLRPVVEVRSLGEQQLLLFIGFHSIVGWGNDGLAWESSRLSWEGVRITRIEGNTLYGLGWDLIRDREAEFSLDLLTGLHQGGGFAQPPQAHKS